MKLQSLAKNPTGTRMRAISGINEIRIQRNSVHSSLSEDVAENKAVTMEDGAGGKKRELFKE